MAEWQEEKSWTGLRSSWRLVTDDGEVVARVEETLRSTWVTNGREFLTLEQAKRATERQLGPIFWTDLTTAKSTAGAEIASEGAGAQAVESLGGADERT